jgi:hypothetical protein
VMITETGWPSAGASSEPAASWWGLLKLVLGHL